MIPDIVEIKRLCASGQWIAKVENGKILLHDTVAGETVCIGNMEAEPVRHGRWVKAQGMMQPEYRHRKCCYLCGGLALQDFYGRERLSYYCPHCGAKMDGGAEDDHQGT